MAGDDVTITIRADSGDAVRAFRDVNGHLRDMRGRFVSESSIMTRSMNQLGKSVGNLKGYLVPLATAGVPVIAALGVASVKTAGSVAGAGLAVSAFGAAVAGQVTHLSAAADAQKKYEDAVVKSGRGSKEAAEAQRQLSASLSRMPNSTARVAVAMQTLKGEFREFSDSTADFTMTPVEKSMTVLGQIIPKLTPMARGASEQLDRLVSVAGGAVASPGFDAFADRVSTFANRSLKEAVDGIIHFSRALSEGQASGPVKAFMDYAEQNGPAVRETLASIGDAAVTLAEGAADAGPGMLTLVGAVADLVAALPPELVTIAMQTAVGLKLMSLAGAGVAATAAGVGRLRDAMLALAATSAAAGGGMAGARAAIGSLSTAVKGGLVAAGIVAVSLGISKLAENARGAPPDVDKLTTSLKELAATGKFTGELKKSFGDIDGLIDDIGKVGQAAKDQEEYVESFGNSGIGPLDDLRRKAYETWDSFTDGEDSVKALEDRFTATDTALASLAKGGHATEAAANFRLIKDAALEQGYSLKELNALFPEYRSAVADIKAEQELTVQSMGMFGQAAQDTSAKLSAQKQSADGLRASILALNEVNRSAYDAQIGFEESLDSLTASFKEHGATLNLDTEAGRANATAMSDAAKSQDELIATGLAAGESLGSMTKKSDELRETMMRLATDAFDGNKKKATEYVNTLLGVPSEIKTLIKAEKDEAIAGLESVQAAITRTPGKKEVKVDTLNAAAIAALEAVGLKTKQLKDGRTAVYTANGKALGSIDSVSRALSQLDGRRANTYTTHTVTTNYVITGSQARRSGVHGTQLANADGNIVEFYASGGTREQHVAQMAPAGTMRVWAEPETGGEAYIPLSPAKRPRSMAVLEEVADRFGYGLEKYARGGVTKAEKEARKSARGDLTISYFGQRAGNKNTEFANDLGAADSLKDLVSSLNKWRSIIKKATHGGVETNLLKRLNSAGAALMKYEKQHDKISKTLEKARALRDSVSSGLKGEAGIVKAAGAEDSRVTINTLLSQMTASAANTKQFSGMLTSLRKKGLSGDLIKQIAEAGISGGGMETAAAILGGGTGEIKKLNDLQKEIGKSAKSAGNAAADAMYGAGMKAGEGLIAGLEKQQKAIEKQMMKIAKSMEKSIRKALGIKSPSTVMEKIGDYTAQGFAVGMTKNRSVTPAWTSMLNQPRTTMPARTTGTPAAPGWGSRPLAVTLQIGTTELGEVIIDPVRKAVSTRGGLRATFGGLD